MSKYRVQLMSPRTEAERQGLCGWAGPEAADRDWEKLNHLFLPASVVGADDDDDGAGKRSTNAATYVKVTGHEPDLTPQPTGCCVADGITDACEGTNANEIAAGEREEFKSLYSPYIYATSRVIHLKNQLRGGQGSTGSAAAAAILAEGMIPVDLEGLPEYTKSNIDLWGDGRSADGKSYTDFLSIGKEHLAGGAVRCTTWEQCRKALRSCYILTIASNRGYSMKPNADGFHVPSGSWSHQMSVWDYDEDCPDRQKGAFIKNQWGDVHGRVYRANGEIMPRGFLRVHLEDFINSHLGMRGCEVFAISRFAGFPSKRKLIKVKLFG